MSPLKRGILLFACTVVLIEIVLRRLGPESRIYEIWKRFIEAIGTVWTAVILSLVYALSIGPISIVMKLLRRDLLDRKLGPEPSFWRTHSPNPLGPQAAARHQF